MEAIRTNWTIEEITSIYNLPILDLVYKASAVHRLHHDPNKIYVNTLISVRTGRCAEDCAYCAQSSHYKTDIEAHNFMTVDEVVAQATNAKNNGVNRVCLSTSGREVSEADFDKLLDMVNAVKGLGMEACCTLGFVTKEKAAKLSEAGIKAFNHNLDTSREFYPSIITTRTFQDRVDTLNLLQDEGIPYCSGGIIGMGETDADRISMLHTLATMKIHPYNVPLNSLVPIPGTKLEKRTQVSIWEMIRMVATARILMPTARVSLAAGRINYTEEGQALCFLAGANSIFFGEKLLTTKNNKIKEDNDMLETLGLTAHLATV